MPFAGLTALVLVRLASAQVVIYDGAVFPETIGWQRDQALYPADRWIDSGWLAQETEPMANGPEQDIYRRSISEFAGSPSFFVEWRMITDGPRTAIPSGAPAGLTASGTMGVFFHFTIAKDQARLIDSQLDVILFDIQPQFPHTYRVEVREFDSAVFIDGDEVYASTIPLPYPTEDSVVVLWARSPGTLAATRWDYVRYGRIPPPAVPGDTNCDGAINVFDIDPFVVALLDAEGYAQQQPACTLTSADLNGDQAVNFFDIDPFVTCIIGGVCP